MPKALKKSGKSSSSLSKFKKLRNPLVVLVLGFILLVFGGINYYRVRILSFNKPVPINPTARGEVPVQVTIPSIGIDLPIEQGEIKNGVWTISYEKPTFLATSARPGTNGNTVIYGHNKKLIFGNLPYLSLGQKIFVKTEDGKIHTYEAYWKDFVPPDRVDLVSPGDKEELTIYTCWGLFDTTRAVIKARPIN